jgi:hypothetical protein
MPITVFFVLLNLVAYSLSHDPVHLKEAEWFMARGQWSVETALDGWRRQFAEGAAVDWPFDRLVAEQLQAGDHLAWEKTILAKFVAVAAEWIHRLRPEMLSREKLESCLGHWWSLWSYGTGDDLMAHYYYIVTPEPGDWRPVQRTEPRPQEEWFFGDRFMSYASQVRWFEPLARFMAVSVIAGEHGGAMASDARKLAYRILDGVDEVRLKWMHDPDGAQLIPELSHMGQCLSSEVLPTFLATYWRGRCARWW